MSDFFIKAIDFLYIYMYNISLIDGDLLWIFLSDLILH
jgi:hypothetical protein